MSEDVGRGMMKRPDSREEQAIALLKRVIGDHDPRTWMSEEEWAEQMDSMDDLELMVSVDTIKDILKLLRGDK